MILSIRLLILKQLVLFSFYLGIKIKTVLSSWHNLKTWNPEDTVVLQQTFLLLCKDSVGIEGYQSILKSPRVILFLKFGRELSFFKFIQEFLLTPCC